jgi:nitronate monooxygenase
MSLASDLRDIWSAGQGIGAVKSAGPARDYIDWLAADYAMARKEMGMAGGLSH